MLQENMKHKEERIHATQKPADLYTYLYQLADLKPGDTVLDPFLGSGSSRIAAYDMGLDFTGYEMNKVYFDLQNDRFDRHTAQYSLFVED